MTDDARRDATAGAKSEEVLCAATNPHHKTIRCELPLGHTGIHNGWIGTQVFIWGTIK